MDSARVATTRRPHSPFGCARTWWSSPLALFFGRLVHLPLGSSSFGLLSFGFVGSQQYSMTIDLDSASDVIFANRSQAKLSKMLWEDVLLDAQKVTELNPVSHVGYQLTHAALRGAQRYDEAIEAFIIMFVQVG
ncbi:hypothetical protein EV424DRAFT_1646321 [Suillus variegatus]|nr:hypothetical protein EV424DRAFT_1646321 [Suillus variegatus]